MTAAGCGLRPARVLVVEDERQTARLLEFILTKAGYQVARAADGTQALSAAAAFLPDAVLLDLQLPGLSGLEVLRRLRAEPAQAGVVVLVLTASSFEVPPAAVLEAGADSHCTKPIAPSTLLAKLRELNVPISVSELARRVAPC
jgi:two-component system, OmpR family, alkaline phosphatase synthesis response regulator PhoP